VNEDSYTFSRDACIGVSGFFCIDKGCALRPLAKLTALAGTAAFGAATGVAGSGFLCPSADMKIFSKKNYCLLHNAGDTHPLNQ
jgi:hypothetical protein